MKRSFALVLVLLCLAGCTREQQPETGPMPSEDITASVTQTTQPAPTEVTEATVPVTEPEAEMGCLQKIRRIDQVIYEGPGYDYPQIGNIGQIGTYTIVEETADAEGNLWGRLKSGLGWVDLTQILAEETDPPVITATYADLPLMENREFERFTVDNGEFSQKVAICAHKDIQNIEFYSVDPVEGKPEQILFTLPACKAGSFFVVDLAFPGDMTAYSIRFTDANGGDYAYVLTESGRGGLWLGDEKGL